MNFAHKLLFGAGLHKFERFVRGGNPLLHP